LLAHEVAADNDVVLDDGLACEDDVGGAVEKSAAGDFVARILQRGVMVRVVIGKERFSRRRRMGEHTVSMYSPRAALFGGMLKSTTMSHASRYQQEPNSQMDVQLSILAQSRATNACLKE
jgi:hypothetical protein